MTKELTPEEQAQANIEYMVWDVAELISVCTKPELEKFNTIIERIIRKREAQGKPTNNGFIVIDTNEPYAKEVAELVDKRKGEKQNANHQ